jgi:hypothetical protein
MINIVFDKKLYPSEAVKMAAKNYKGLADFQIKETEKSIEAIIKNITPELKANIGDEFCNYVLAVTKNETRIK